MEKFTRKLAYSPDFIKTFDDAGMAQLGHLNAIVQNLPAYKSYTALFTQDGTNAPVMIEMENSLDFSLTWVRGSEGYYYADWPTGIEIPFTKFWIGGSMGSWRATSAAWIPISNVTGAILGRYAVYPNSNGTNVNGIALECYDDQWVAEEFSTLFGVNNPVNESGVYIEFRIYN